MSIGEHIIKVIGSIHGIGESHHSYCNELYFQNIEQQKHLVEMIASKDPFTSYGELHKSFIRSFTNDFAKYRPLGFVTALYLALSRHY